MVAPLGQQVGVAQHLDAQRVEEEVLAHSVRARRMRTST